MLKQDIAAYVDGWVIKRETDAAPRRILAEDIDFLNDLVSDQQGKVHANAWQALSTALSGWLVQRARGERPGAPGASDFEAFLAFLPASSDPHATPDPAEETIDTPEILAQNDTSATSPDPMPENLVPENPEAPSASETPVITLNPPANDLVETQVTQDIPVSDIPAFSEAMTAPSSRPRRQPHEAPNPDRFAGLAFSRYHVENGV